VIVISDTSPINYLCQVGHIEVLRVLFEQVLIPPVVAYELSRDTTPSPVRQFMAHFPAWLVIRSPKGIDSTLVKFGLGEREKPSP